MSLQVKNDAKYIKGFLSLRYAFSFSSSYFLSAFSLSLSLQRIAACLSPSPAWGPAEERHRQEWTQHRLKHPLRHRLLHPGLCAAEPSTSPDELLNTIQIKPLVSLPSLHSVQMANLFIFASICTLLLSLLQKSELLFEYSCITIELRVFTFLTNCQIVYRFVSIYDYCKNCFNCLFALYLFIYTY